jgi:hypothetical protein
MTTHVLKSLLPSLLSDAETAVVLAKTAEGSKQSLGGHGPYAKKFHDRVVYITGTANKVRPHLGGLDLSPAELSSFDSHLATITATTGKAKDRNTACRNLKLLCETVILHKAEAMTASPVPSTEQVLPLDVVKGTWQLVKIVTQANGCYERQWYDACSVMIRKLAELLIVAVFEKQGVVAELKDGNNTFLTLSKLIVQMKSKQVTWSLGREVGPCLDKMKEIGDRSAHNRFYVATKPDVDGLINSGLRVMIEELMTRAGLK